MSNNKFISEQDRLHLAIEENDIDTVRALLQNTPSLLSEETEPELASFHIAIKCKRVEIIRLLLNFYDVSRVNTDHESNFLLFVAVQVGDIEFLRSWKSNGGATFNVTNNRGEVLLHRAVRYLDFADRWTLVEYLLSEGADPNIRNKDGLTPLHYAVDFMKEGNASMVAFIIWLLVKSGAEIDARDNAGRTALILAQMKKKSSCVLDLLRFGADIESKNGNGMTILECIHDALRENGCFQNLRFRELVRGESDFFESVKALIYHVNKLKVLRLNKKNYERDEVFLVLSRWYNFMSSLNIDFSNICKKDNQSTEQFEEFAVHWKAEKQKLIDTKLDKHTCMYKILFMDDQRMSELSRRKSFQSYFENQKCKKDFPNFWYFLEMKYNAGIVRNILRPLAKDAIKYLNLHLPEICLDLILVFFTNSELKNFIEIISTMNPEICKNKTEIIILLIKNNHFNLDVLND